jgi:hypothetical protein
MLNHILKSRPVREGTTIERIWTYELTSVIAFGGRRRRVYRRIVALSGARPGGRVLDIGCNGGYLARRLVRRGHLHARRAPHSRGRPGRRLRRDVPGPAPRRDPADRRLPPVPLAPRPPRPAPAQAIDLAPLAEAAGFRVEAAGDLPMLHYIRAVR